MTYYYDEQKEISEAINAANEAIYHLDKSEQLLKKAGNWGIADMLGGGFFITMMKRDRMRSAQNEIEQAKSSLRKLTRELGDIHNVVNVEFEMDDFLGVADYLFDNIFVDIMTQNKIDSAKLQVRQTIEQVERILDYLESMVV